MIKKLTIGNEAYGACKAYRTYGLVGIVVLLGLLGLASCSSDSDEERVEPVVETPAVEIPVAVRGLVADFQDNMPVTRGWIPPTGYQLLDNSENVIAVSFTQNTKEPINGHLFKSGDEWRINKEIDAGTYYLYGYVPHSVGINYSISSSATPGDNTSYSSGAVLTLENVPAIMPRDLCVVIGAKNGVDDYKEDVDYTVADLRRGKFEYAAATIEKDGGGTGNFIYLLFDHLYAGMNFHMRVHADYDAVRTIKLKNIELQAVKGDTPAKEKSTIVVTMTANDGTTSPISSVVFTPTGDNTVKTSIFKSDNGLTLTTDYQTFPGYFTPKGVTKVLLTCTYDVYDTKDNLIRQNCKATNELRLADLYDRFDEMRAGTRYNIYITVHPTYLYVLSDPDLDDPVMEVE